MSIRRSLLGTSDKSALLLEAAAAINAGRLIILPVTSGYVLACDAQNASALSDLDAARHAKNEYISSIIFPDIATLANEVTLPELDPALVEIFEKGLLTLILKRDLSFRSNHGGTKELIAVNIPENSWVQNLLAKTGPCAVGAASIINEGIPKKISEVSQEIKNVVEIAVDAGTIKGSVSTVINFVEKKPVIVRIGTISESEIKALIPNL